MTSFTQYSYLIIYEFSDPLIRVLACGMGGSIT